MTVPTDRSEMPLAIVGMACRLPGAENLSQYWEMISQGTTPVAEVPPEMLDQSLYYEDRKGVRGKSYSKMAALLANREFDPTRCPIAPELLHSVDRTHLLMTGVAADALRHAGLDPFALPARNTAVFIGHAQGSSRLGELTFSAYLEEALALLADTPEFADQTPQVQALVQQRVLERLGRRGPQEQSSVRHLYCNMVAGTVAKAFGLSGPWLALNSACASSLHAMLLGARALQLGRADMAIVGGASDCKSDSLVLFSAAQTLSTTASRPFDADADGLIMSEGYVALVMKTLERALADGDPIQAVVRGLGIASDGRGKSLWAPRKEGQMKAMLRAYRSGVDMAGLQYLEAHATSTQVGDATELETLGEVLGPKFPPGKKIPVTSAKASIGHTLEAAGVAGVIKTVLCMQNRTFPPAINIRSLNPKIDWQKAPYFIPQTTAPWEAPGPGLPRRAAVNAFGIGGLNMHVVLDEFTPSARQLIHSGASAPQPATTEDRSVAIIGIGCVLPGAIGPAQLWQSLEQGHDPKVAPPAERWTRAALAAERSSGTHSRGGFVTDFEYDWRKQKIPPKQVAEADPLQFMLLAAAEQALADAGYDRKPFDRETCGVVVGTEFGGDFCDHLEMGLRLPEIERAIGEQLRAAGVDETRIGQICAGYAKVLLKKWPSLVDETGSFTSSTLASRITKTLDLAGGAVAIDSGSTSAISGLSVAIDMLLAGDNDLMICAAGQRRMGPNAFEALGTAGLLAADGQPRNLLDVDYAGIVPAEGVGVVLLKRLADARRDGDRIHAVIRGLGIAHHPSNAEAIRLAAERSIAMAGVDAADVVLAELDTDEQLSASRDELANATGATSSTPRRGSLVVGSPTAQFGHLGGAAGMAALLKASLEIENGRSVPAVGLSNPAAVDARERSIHAAQGGEKLTGRRLTAVACWSKGMACHLILDSGESVQPIAKPAVVRSALVAQPVTAARVTTTNDASAPRIIRFGGKDRAAVLARLQQGTGNAALLWQAPATEFAASDHCRLAIVADSAEALARKSQMALAQLQNPAASQVLEQQGIFCRDLPINRPRVVFVFPGQGSQYDGMLRELVSESAGARAALESIDATMRALDYPSLAQLAWEPPTELGKDVWLTQHALLLADTIVAAALAERGITPDLVLGHSYGEFPALLAAGVWDLATAAQMTHARCQGIASVAKGATGMLATNADAAAIVALRKDISDQLYLANLNAPDQVVVGGRTADLQRLAQVLEAQGHQARILAVPAAFHTPLMAGASRQLEQQLQSATLHTAVVPLVSTVTGAQVKDAHEVRRNLAAQLTTPVRYAELIARLADEQPTVFVEVGPHQTLTRLNRRIAASCADAIASDNPKRPGLEALVCVQALLECLGALPAQKEFHQSRPSESVTGRTAARFSNQSLQSSAKTSPMHDSIPHFDATERRRAKKRDGGAKPVAPTNGDAHRAPAPPVPATVARVTRPAPVAPRTDPPSNSPAVGRFTAAPASLPTPSAGPTAKSNGTPAADRAALQPQGRASSAAKNGHAVDEISNGHAATNATSRMAPEELKSFLINFVVEQTGYPSEVVELDADLEADLGIDSIKKAQLFGELQEYFDIGSDATNLSLDDFPTLGHVLAFLSQQSSTTGGTPSATAQPTAAPQTPPAAPTAPRPARSQPPAMPQTDAVTPAASAASAAPNLAELESFLINFVVEQTGYPSEVVELDADLEADLGIDSIKKAQLFGELQEYFDVGTSATTLSLDDFPTLRHVLDFLAGHAAGAVPGRPPDKPHEVAEPAAIAPATTVSPAAPAPVAAAEPTSAAAASIDPAELENFLVNFVVEQTGYPREVVELDADLEADLGIDSIKKAQLFGELQEYFDVGTSATSLSLDDFPTLRHVLDFLRGASAVSEQAASATMDPAPAVADITPIAPAVAPAPHDRAELESFLINFVVEQTGYPREVVELDADLEADLGIDSIKKAQLFGELQEYFDVGTATTSLSLDDFPTLRHVLDFLASGDAGSAIAEEDRTAVHPISDANRNGHAAKPAAAPADADTQPATPYECGRTIGALKRIEIVRALRDSVDRMADLNGSIHYQNGHAGTHVTLTPDELDELQGMADAVEVPLRSLVAQRLAIRPLMRQSSSESARRSPTSTDSVPPSSWIELPSEAVTTRFAIEVRDAPWSAPPSEPRWRGSAVVLGISVVATVLVERLRRSGAEVHLLAPGTSRELVLAELERICQLGPAPHLFLCTAADGITELLDEPTWNASRDETLLAPFWVCQKWLQLATAGNWLEGATLVATTAMGGDFGLARGAIAPQGGGVAGLLKAIFIEYTVMQQLDVRVKVIDAPADVVAESLAENVVRELGSGLLDYEVGFVADRRCVPFAVEKSIAAEPSSLIRSGGTWVVTGGARGITAACALELGRRFGLRLHLLGSSPAPQIDPAWRQLDEAGVQRLKATTMVEARKNGQPAAAAWDRVQKDLEIDRSLRAFAVAGVAATYHACDVANRDQLAAVLAKIRHVDGPIEGILHGAGIDRSCRFDRKQPDVVRATIGAKVDGAAHLMALTRHDPIRHFIGFGSISGRLGSFGQTDYCLASDQLCKLIGAYRRERPWIKAVGFHWHPWDEVGMAARPETKNILQGKSDLRLMPLAEGVAHLLRELAAGAPEPEVLITERRHWERFAKGLGSVTAAPQTPVRKSAVQSVEPTKATAAASTTASPPGNVPELHTHRCCMRAIDAPLPPQTPAAPALSSPAWILGDNRAAQALAERLRRSGCKVSQIPLDGPADGVLQIIDGMWAKEPAGHLFLMTGRDPLNGDLLDRPLAQKRSDRAVLLPFLVAQRWYKLLGSQSTVGQGTLVAVVSLGGDFGFSGLAPTPDGGAMCGLLKAVHIEDSRRESSRVRAKVIDAPADEQPAALADAILRELAAHEPEVEVCWSAGVRRVIRPIPTNLQLRDPRQLDGGTWVVTGGARGITAIAGKELARRHGWKLHLLGKSPAPQADAPWRNLGEAEMKALKTSLARQAVAEGRSPAEAWDRVMKDVEIFNNLRDLAQAGISAHYHACDIADPQSLSKVLDEVRRIDGPIRGILHGAGVIDPGRFESKRREVVVAQIGAKFDGTLNLMSLASRDPLEFFVAFGSISGRFGGNGLTDYATGNDALAKLVDWHRAQRPNCASACIHWESWEGSGMATLPRFAWGPKSVMNMKYMQPDEGVYRLENEMLAGLPDSEILYTFGDFYPMFYPAEQRPLGPFVPGSTEAVEPPAPLATPPAVRQAPLLSGLSHDQQSVAADVRLDPLSDPFLVQHRLRDKPLLPVVVGLEALAEAASALTGARKVAFKNVQMIDGLLFHSDQPVTARVVAQASATGAIECELNCDFRNRSGGLIQQARPYLRATVEMPGAAEQIALARPAAPATWTSFTYPDDGPVYHGPALRGAKAVSLDAAGGWGRVEALPMEDLIGAQRTQGWTIPSCVLDAALYVCGIHLWMHGQQAISLPRAIEYLQIGRMPESAETCLVYLACHTIETGSALYDFTVVGADGTLIAAARGYQKVILARGGAR